MRPSGSWWRRGGSGGGGRAVAAAAAAAVWRWLRWRPWRRSTRLTESHGLTRANAVGVCIPSTYGAFPPAPPKYSKGVVISRKYTLYHASGDRDAGETPDLGVAPRARPGLFSCPLVTGCRYTT